VDVASVVLAGLAFEVVPGALVGGSMIGEVVVGPPVVGGLELDVSGEIWQEITSDAR